MSRPFTARAGAAAAFVLAALVPAVALLIAAGATLPASPLAVAMGRAAPLVAGLVAACATYRAWRHLAPPRAWTPAALAGCLVLFLVAQMVDHAWPGGARVPRGIADLVLAHGTAFALLLCGLSAMALGGAWRVAGIGQIVAGLAALLVFVSYVATPASIGNMLWLGGLLLVALVAGIVGMIAHGIALWRWGKAAPAAGQREFMAVP